MSQTRRVGTGPQHAIFLANSVSPIIRAKPMSAACGRELRRNMYPRV